MACRQEGVFVLKEKGFRMLLLKSSRSGFLLGEMIKKPDKPLVGHFPLEFIHTHTGSCTWSWTCRRRAPDLIEVRIFICIFWNC